jgi:uncharacterized protein with PQ loop repeat
VKSKSLNNHNKSSHIYILRYLIDSHSICRSLRSPNLSIELMHPNDSVPLVVVSIGLVSSILLYLSPIPVVHAIVRKKSVMYFRPDSFVIGIAYAICKFPYPIINYQIGPIISSAVSLTLYSCYLGIYWWFSCPQQARYTLRITAWTLLVCISILGIGPLIFFLLSQTQPDWVRSQGGLPALIEIYFGVCSTLSVVLLMSSQLTAIRQVFRENDSRCISGYMLAGNIFCALCWTVYSVLIMNPYFLAANAVGDLACLVQLVLKISYHRPSIVKESQPP